MTTLGFDTLSLARKLEAAPLGVLPGAPAELVHALDAGLKNGSTAIRFCTAGDAPCMPKSSISCASNAASASEPPCAITYR